MLLLLLGQLEENELSWSHAAKAIEDRRKENEPCIAILPLVKKGEKLN